MITILDIFGQEDMHIVKEQLPLFSGASIWNFVSNTAFLRNHNNSRHGQTCVLNPVSVICYDM